MNLLKWLFLFSPVLLIKKLPYRNNKGSHGQEVITLGFQPKKSSTRTSFLTYNDRAHGKRETQSFMSYPMMIEDICMINSCWWINMPEYSCIFNCFSTVCFNIVDILSKAYMPILFLKIFKSLQTCRGRKKSKQIISTMHKLLFSYIMIHDPKLHLWEQFQIKFRVSFVFFFSSTSSCFARCIISIISGFSICLWTFIL